MMKRSIIIFLVVATIVITSSMTSQQTFAIFTDSFLAIQPPSIPSSNLDPKNTQPNLPDVASPYGILFQTINNPNPESHDDFGYSVASTPNGNILIGAPGDDSGVKGAGSVYLYNSTTGALLWTINNPTPEADDDFGYSVASTPNGHILIGDPDDTNGDVSFSGSVFLYDGITGRLLKTINNPNPEYDNDFGYSVASTPNGNILVGAPGDSTVDYSAGSIHLFDATNGNQLLKINNPMPAYDDNFGMSVASTPNGNIIVGDRGIKTNLDDTDSIHLFDGETGILLLRIDNPDYDDDKFGQSVASTPKGNIIVGAPADGAVVNSAGSVHVYDGITGTLLQTLENPFPDPFDSMGAYVASTPNGNILVGDPEDTKNDSARSGSVYLFDGTNGNKLLTINNPSPEPFDYFGRSVTSTFDGKIIVGEPGKDLIGADSAGAVQIFVSENLYYVIEKPPEAKQLDPNSGFTEILEDSSNSFKENTTEVTTQIPDWIRNNAKWWAEDVITDQEFKEGIGFLIKERVINISETEQLSSINTSLEIPLWIKNNAEWWSKGLISDGDFTRGIQFMLENGIITV